MGLRKIGSKAGQASLTQELKTSVDLIEIVKASAESVYDVLGGGFMEKVYQEALAVELRKYGINYVMEYSTEVYYDNHKVGTCILDFLVEDSICIECKALGAINSLVSENQLRAYLRAINLPMGVFINFSKANELVVREIQAN